MCISFSLLFCEYYTTLKLRKHGQVNVYKWWCIILSIIINEIQIPIGFHANMILDFLKIIVFVE
jgi:hypothetical protein